MRSFLARCNPKSSVNTMALPTLTVSKKQRSWQKLFINEYHDFRLLLWNTNFFQCGSLFDSFGKDKQDEKISIPENCFSAEDVGDSPEDFARTVRVTAFWSLSHTYQIDSILQDNWSKYLEESCLRRVRWIGFCAGSAYCVWWEGQFCGAADDSPWSCHRNW